MVPADGALAVEVRGLTRRFGDTLALDGVDLDVAQGCVHGLLGPNGAGKTTLLRILVGLVRSESGTVRVLGRDPALGPRAREGVAALIEAPRFRPALSAEDNLRLLADLDGGRPRSVLEDAIDVTGLTADRSRPVRHFSLGMRQRLGMAAALIRLPRLLILDEPANGLDPAGTRDMFDLIARLAADGRTVLLASHDMADVAAACDSVTILVRGRVARSGAVATLRAEAPHPAHLLETADDARAAQLAASLGIETSPTRGDTRPMALCVRAGQDSMDALVAALARADVAVRTLRLQTEPLQALFFEPAGRRVAGRRVAGRHFAGRRVSRAVLVARWELRSFAALWRVRICLLACALGPFAFVAALRSQTQLPEDSLFGRWVTESGFALPLLVLGFVAQWAFPALTALVAGDVFSGEDAHGTWKTVLTRSTSKGEIFAGKCLAAAGWALVLLAVLTVSSTVAGIVMVGRQPLVGLSGQLVPSGHALADVLGSWALALPPLLGFTCLALALSVVSRSSVVGVVGPVLIGLLMQLYPFLGRSDVAGHLLLAFHFSAWHSLLLVRPGLQPVVESLAVSVAYACGALGVAWWRFSDRDELG